MTRDQYMEEVFLKPPLVAYRRPRNLRECLSEQNSQTGNTRDQGGKWREWENVRTVLSVHWHWWRLGTRSDQHHQNMSIKWEESLTARQNICYVVFCKKKGCSLQYIGESKHTAQHRWSQQRLRDRARQSGNWRTFQLQRSHGRHGVLHLRNIQERSPPP